MTRFHVSIVGAGLGGLCLAQGLKRLGIPFDVFERDASPESRGQGYRIRIDAVGQRALQACLPPDLYSLFRQSASTAASSGRFLTPQLEPVSARAPEAWQRVEPDGMAEQDKEDLSVNRQTLRDILLSGIHSHVHFGRSFEDFELTSDARVSVRFADAEPIVTTLLVGADGVNSRVRRRLVPDAEPTDTETVCLYGKSDLAEWSDVGVLHEGTSVIFADRCAAILDAMRFRASLPDLASRIVPPCHLTPVSDYMYWAIIVPRERLGLANAEPRTVPADDLAACIERLIHDWHPALRKIILGSDPKVVSMVPVRCSRPDVSVPTGVVTLLGDAIHVMSPAGGLGANTALDDARSLVDAITRAAGEQAEVASALATYGADMRARAAHAIAASREGSARLLSATAREAA